MCTPAVGRKESDAIMDHRPVLPAIIGYIGAQALLPALGKCPDSIQIQPPWFKGDGIGAGICPLEYWNLPTALVGAAIIAVGAAYNYYSTENRLLIDSSGIGTVKVKRRLKKETEGLVIDDRIDNMVLFSDIADWKMTPLGLLINRKLSSSSFYTIAWDSKSVEELLKERLKQAKRK